MIYVTETGIQQQNHESGFVCTVIRNPKSLESKSNFLTDKQTVQPPEGFKFDRNFRLFSSQTFLLAHERIDDHE